ncbi:ATPase [candidate division TA06 bacterium DG_24]|uniref:ATPase n=3 Tax=Bacteria division TA06 TaxID=1156500 RepID=A0A0S8JN45_UNCT6|nr:MAG: ATPase [candidate division TA06 bacterium DG_24]KPK70654.1 MAG: ATPase [candidate division TA06 bacterium SM23_40]KPL10944.1 MAG: ATPase [candidate division TA06 bacterium SM1_40]
MDQDIQAIHEKIDRESAFVEAILAEVGKVIVGQRAIMERLLIGILSGGHILIEGVPGLAKTLAVKTLSDTIETKFQRIQFTPDLLPADLIGTMIFNQEKGDFTPKKGPIFANIILADEINRAPAKVQSALLEAMQERQVTIGETTFPLDEPFLVLATQNPIEQEGTYPLPEAQVDRFMLKLKIDYPTRKEEREIIERMTSTSIPTPDPVVKPERIIKARSVVGEVYVDDRIKEYILDIVFATRQPDAHGVKGLEGFIEYGASPRASIYLTIAAKAHSFLRRRGYVTPEDVKAIGMDVLRHRIILTYEAEAENMTTEDVIQQIFDTVEVP